MEYSKYSTARPFLKTQPCHDGFGKFCHSQKKTRGASLVDHTCFFFGKRIRPNHVTFQPKRFEKIFYHNQNEKKTKNLNHVQGLFAFSIVIKVYFVTYKVHRVGRRWLLHYYWYKVLVLDTFDYDLICIQKRYSYSYILRVGLSPNGLPVSRYRDKW